MIKLDSVSKVFNAGKANEVTALSNLSLTVSYQDFLVIVGANGSGKSTLLNIISGNIFPSRGGVELDNNSVTRLTEYQRSKWIARVFQNPLSGTAPDLSILDNFRLAGLRTTSKKLTIGITNDFKKLVQDKISILGMGLENKIHQPMGTLSGGQRQALTLVMSVMDDVKILLLDEPTAALDPRSAETVMTTANKLISEYTLTAILITHHLKDAFKYGNRIIQMEDGKIIKDINHTEKLKLTEIDLYKWFI